MVLTCAGQLPPRATLPVRDKRKRHINHRFKCVYSWYFLVNVKMIEDNMGCKIVREIVIKYLFYDVNKLFVNLTCKL
jgi:hypothetical protein